MTATQRQLIEKIGSLAPAQQAEVEDFVDFLRARKAAQDLTRSAAQASEPSLAQVWDNDDDAVYDRL